MWETLSAAIVTMVKTSSFVDSALVFDYGKSDIGGFPAVTVTPSDAKATFGDNVRIQREYTFSIKCYQERLNQGEDKSEQIMRQMVDDLIRIFDADTYLLTTLDGRGFAYPIPSAWSFVQGENINLRVAEVLITAVVVQ